MADTRGSWGTIAYNDRNKRWGVVWDNDGQVQADAGAIAKCGAGCSVVFHFVGRGQCGAFARGNGTSWGTGLGANRSEAEANAVARCSTVARGCVAKVWGCNAH